MRGWVGVRKSASEKIAGLLLRSGSWAIALPQPSALLAQSGFERFIPYSIQIFHAMIAPSAQTNLENLILTGFGAAAVEILINPY
ncbi:hypothetical protein ACF3DV_32160 [Chlorogloeopsis fritschii PCC 9212]|uniref:hypothetical protein n=1 Tax=Chlorogloeopsis fritschii TaxID=1124 RepID=UPI0002DDD676|nr:hypothetical protein [Chlorogloeopsis fritschii]